MVVCVPVNADGSVDPRWGRADRVAVAQATPQGITTWEELDVGWSTLHDAGGEGAHHARVARLLIDHRVDTVVANHMGPGMLNMLEKMGISIHLGAEGNARNAVVAALGAASS
jgi:predicted Fe-Mo cluster-binding NifX family protein